VDFSAASNVYYYAFTLAPGDPPVINNNFPLVKAVALGDRVWEDADGDGVQDAGEPGLTNVTVRLLDASSNVVAVTATDASGTYLFTNLPPAVYAVEFVPPSEYVFTARDAAAATDATDSDADLATCRTDSAAYPAGTTNLTLDAGLYVPAQLFGYVFVDKDADFVRDTGDSSVTNALVTLTVNGVAVATTLTDALGYYFFGDIPVGAASVLVSRAGATLIDVPTEEPAASDVRRNRGEELPDDAAYIDYAVTSGYGVLASKPGEPLNFGFSYYPLSSALSIRPYATGGGVSIELWTVNEAGYQDIVVYAWIDGAWAEVGRVPADEVEGEGSNRYWVQAAGLEAGRSYLFKVRDEEGHTYVSHQPVAVVAIRVEAVSLDLQTMRVTFNTEPGRRYVVRTSADLAAPPESWTAARVRYPVEGGWSELSDQPFNAGPGASTQVLVPVNQQRAYFKIVMADEE